MKLLSIRTLSLAGLAGIAAGMLATAAFSQPPQGVPWGDPSSNSSQTTTTVTGTIVQFNYNHDATIQGFLLTNSVLVNLPPAVVNKIGGSLKVNDSISVTGYEFTDSTSNLTVIGAQSITDSTAGVTVTLPKPSATTVTGSGAIQQLNYGPRGDVNGFWLDASTLLLFPPIAPKTADAFTVGASVTYTAYTRTTLNNATVLQPTALSVGGTAITLGGPGGFGGPGGGQGGPPPGR
jgi:hypothetical protein